MNELRFSWRDEDPVALIFLILLVVVLFFVPWQRCDPLEGLKTPEAAAAAVDAVPASEPKPTSAPR